MLSFIRIRAVDIIDVLLVALLFFYFLRFLKGTRAIRMLYALLLLVAVSFAARWLDFKALGLIVNSLTTLWIVAFVILFQPELRSLLTRFGRYRGLRFLLKHGAAEEAAAAEVVEAAGQLKQRRIGGLIVVERGLGLREYIETGTRLDARVSAALLVSIFTPPSPLHDGAVIISGDRVVAAACTLPLSEVTYRNGFLGMRHRAGLGIATLTDAFAVIVSETSGRITFASRSRLMVDLTPTQLKYNIGQSLQKES
jgi:diadenylate cyclase